jgi:acetyl esterase
VTATARLATLAEEPLRRLGAAVHPRLPPDGLPGMDADVARTVAAAGSLDTSRLPVPLMRVGYRLQTTLWNRPRETAVTVDDERVNDHLVVRTYTPHVERGGGIVYFHGGGMVIGDLDTHDRWCRWTAVRAGVVVHAVDYRLAPEHPFPAGCIDALVAWNHVVAGWRAQGRPLGRLGVGGDSAGGYLALLVATQAVAPTLGVPGSSEPGFVWVLYPGVDAVRRPEQFEAFPSGVMLTGRTLERFSKEWLGDEDPADAAHSPGLVDDDVLAQLPPMHLVTCEFDPLTPECLRLRDRLASLDVELTHAHHDDLPHEFISTTGVSSTAADAGGAAIDALGRLADG